MNDLRYALRQLRKHPFTNCVIVLTIALLIGAVSVIYASFRNDQMRYSPFPEPERVVKLWRIGEKRIDQLFPADLYQDYAERLTSFEEIGALDWRQAMTLTDVGEPVSYNTAGVSSSLLRLTQVSPLVGRIFDEADAEPGAAQAVLISEKVWREKLGGDEQVVGRELRLNNNLCTVVGVLPEAMRMTRLAFNVDLWLPAQFDRKRQGVSLWLFGRLKPDVTLKQAQAELDTVAPALEVDHAPDERERAIYPGGFQTARVTPLDKQLNNSSGIPAELVFIWLFAGTIIGSIVGIACFNVTNLLLARVGARSREIAIRISIGAARWRIVRQLLTETVLLAAVGGALGLVVSFWLFDLLRLHYADVRFDWRLYSITAGGTLALGILVGLVPAFRSARTDLTEALKEGGQTVGGRHRHRVRNFLVSSEVAMALILCVVAGLLARAYFSLYRDDLGLDPGRTVTISVELRQDTYRQMEERRAYADRALQALNELPGVEAAAVSLSPSNFGWSMRDQITIAAAARSEERNIEADVSYASHHYAPLSGMRILQGRDLSGQSTKAADEALVNQEFVARHFGNEDPIGRQVRVSRDKHWVTIVGVTKNRHPLTTYTESRAEIILHHRRGFFTTQTGFIVLTKGAAKAMAQPIRAVLQRLDASQPVNQPVFMADLLEQRTEGPRNGMFFLGTLAGVGLFIALMGVYGVVAYSVMERTREVGIRMALGATPREVLRLMLWQGARLLLLGAAPGLVTGSLLVLALPSHGLGMTISPFDPLTHATVIVFVGLAGFLASALPARKAAHLDPMEALRHE